MPLEKLAIFILVVVTTTTSASRPGTTDDAEKMAKDEEERMAKMLEWSRTATPPSDIVAPSPGGPISCTAACMDICMVLEPPSDHVCELACEFGCAQVRGRGKIKHLPHTHKHNHVDHHRDH